MKVPATMHILDTPEELYLVEELQRAVWPGNDTEIVPVHMLATAVHNGGVVIGAFDQLPGEDTPKLVGFVFGFPGFYQTPDGPRLKHCSHMLGVHPQYRDQGLGFSLKRAQWQVVRHQSLDRITWTYDPLMSRNAHLNISKLGAVCNTYRENFYGVLRDGINVGLPSDRFQVDWWVNSRRVERRLGRRPRPPLELADYSAAGVPVVNATRLSASGWSQPIEAGPIALPILRKDEEGNLTPARLLLVEIPFDFLRLKELDPDLGLAWRLHARQVFQTLFNGGYLVTDFVHQAGSWPRSYYVLSFGEAVL